MVVGFIVRKILYVLIGLVALAVLAFLGVGVALDRVIKTGVETVGPLIMKVPLRVENVDASLLRGSFALQGFEVGNPEGYEAPHAIRVGRMQVDAHLRTLLTDTVELPLIEVEQADMTLELKDGQTNFSRILEQMPKERKTEKEFRIGTLRVRQPSVAIGGLPGGQELRVQLPDVELTDLSAGGEAKSPEELIRRILKILQEQVLGQAGEEIPTEELERLREQVLEQGREAVEKGAEELRKRFEDLLE